MHLQNICCYGQFYSHTFFHSTSKPTQDHTDILQWHFFAVHTKKLFDLKEKKICVVKNGSPQRWRWWSADLWNNMVNQGRLNARKWIEMRFLEVNLPARILKSVTNKSFAAGNFRNGPKILAKLIKNWLSYGHFSLCNVCVVKLKISASCRSPLFLKSSYLLSLANYSKMQ